MAVNSIATIASSIGVSELFVKIIYGIITTWEIVWSGLAMWRASKNNHKLWFAVFLILNLLAIPEIIYLIVTGKKAVKEEKINKKGKK